MSYTNSPLVNYTKISPNRTANRSHAIDTITIHCVVGQCTVETLGAIFASASRQASSNYGVGKDGRIGMYVEEKDRSWCSSSSANDNRAVTIEVASDTTAPYKVTDAAYNALIRLVADICRRNGITKLLWRADKSLIGQVDKQNMTVHRWFANKSCPGDYLYERHYDIASKVNAILGGGRAILEKGAYGDDVKELQEKLLQLGYSLGGYGADKEFGECTEKAVIRFQIDHALKADGVVGDDTWRVLEATEPADKPAEPEPSETSYVVRVLSQRPIYREPPQVIGQCGNGSYTIVETSGSYGKLKSGAGWIQLDAADIV